VTAQDVRDELVDRIVAEIVKRVAAKEAAAQSPSPPPCPAAKPPLLVSGPLGALAPETAAALSAQFDIVAAESFDTSGLPRAPLLMTGLGLQALVRVSQGDEGCTVEGRLLLEALLEGRRAVILEGGIVWRRHQGTAPKPLIASYLACEAALASCGALIRPDSLILEALKAPIGPPAAPAAPARCQAPGLPPRAGRVLSEARVRELFPRGTGPATLELSPGDVLTPLARDYLLAQKIELA
jgi:hypothetical protein